MPELHDQEFLIKKIALPGKRKALLCVGGNPLGVRYGISEIIKRLQYKGGKLYLPVEELRDKPYFSFRALYPLITQQGFGWRYDMSLWSLEKWKRAIDSLVFFGYSVLQIWGSDVVHTSVKMLKGDKKSQEWFSFLHQISDYCRQRRHF